MSLTKACLVLMLACLLASPACVSGQQTRSGGQQPQQSYQAKVKTTQQHSEVLRSTQQLKRGTIIKETIKTCKVLDPCVIGKRSARTFARAISILVTSQGLPEATGHSYVESMLRTHKDKKHIDQDCFRDKFNELYQRYFKVYKTQQFETLCKTMTCNRKTVQEMYKELWNLQDRLEILEQEINDDAFPLASTEAPELENERRQLKAAIKQIKFKIASCKKPKDFGDRRGNLHPTGTTTYDYDSEEKDDLERVHIIERNTTYREFVERNITKILKIITDDEDKRRQIDDKNWRIRIREVIERLEREKLNSINKTVIEININRITNTSSPHISDKELEDRLRELEDFRKQSHKILLGHRRGTLGNPDDPFFEDDRQQVKREWDFEIEKFKRRQAANRWDLKNQLQEIRLVTKDIEVEIHRLSEIPKMTRLVLIYRKYLDFYRNKQVMLIELMEKTQPMVKKIEDLRSQIRKSQQVPNYLRLLYNLDEELEALLQERERLRFETAKRIYFQETNLITSIQVIIKEDLENLRVDPAFPADRKQVILNEITQRYNDMEAKKVKLFNRLNRLVNKINRRRIVRYTKRLLIVRIVYYKHENKPGAVRLLRDYLNRLNDQLIEKWKRQAEKRELISKIRIEEDRITQIIERQFKYIEMHQKDKLPQIEDAKNQKIKDSMREEENKVKELEKKISEITENHDRMVQEILRKITEQEKCTTATLVHLEQEKDKTMATKRGVLGDYQGLSDTTKKSNVHQVLGSAEKLDTQKDAISQYILVCSRNPYPVVTVEDGNTPTNLNNTKDIIEKKLIIDEKNKNPNVNSERVRKYFDDLRKVVNQTSNPTGNNEEDLLKELPNPKHCDESSANRLISQLTSLENEKRGLLKQWGELGPEEQAYLDYMFRTALYHLSHKIAEIETYLKLCGQVVPHDHDHKPSKPVQENPDDSDLLVKEEDVKLRRIYFTRVRAILRKLRNQRIYRVKNDPVFGRLDTSRRSERLIRRKINELQGDKDMILKVWEELMPRHQQKYTPNLEIALSSIIRNIQLLEDILTRFPQDDPSRNQTSPVQQLPHLGSPLAPQSPEEQDIDRLIEEQIVRQNKEIEAILGKSPRYATEADMRKVAAEAAYLNLQKTLLYDRWKRLRSDQHLPREKDFALAVSVLTKEARDLEDLVERFKRAALPKQHPSKPTNPNTDQLDDGIPHDNTKRWSETKLIRDIYNRRRESLVRTIEFDLEVPPKKIHELLYWSPSQQANQPPSSSPRHCLKATATALRLEEKRLIADRDLIASEWADLLPEDQALLRHYYEEATRVIAESLQQLDNYLASCSRAHVAKPKARPPTQSRRANVTDHREQPGHANDKYVRVFESLKHAIQAVRNRSSPHVDDIVKQSPTRERCTDAALKLVDTELHVLVDEKTVLERLYSEIIQNDRIKVTSEYNFAIHILEVKIEQIQVFEHNCQRFKVVTTKIRNETTIEHHHTPSKPNEPRNTTTTQHPTLKGRSTGTKRNDLSTPSHPSNHTSKNHTSNSIPPYHTNHSNSTTGHPKHPTNVPKGGKRGKITNFNHTENHSNHVHPSSNHSGNSTSHHPGPQNHSQFNTTVTKPTLYGRSTSPKKPKIVQNPHKNHTQNHSNQVPPTSNHSGNSSSHPPGPQNHSQPNTTAPSKPTLYGRNTSPKKPTEPSQTTNASTPTPPTPVTLKGRSTSRPSPPPQEPSKPSLPTHPTQPGQPQHPSTNQPNHCANPPSRPPLLQTGPR
jgi:hypothetical protein